MSLTIEVLFEAEHASLIYLGCLKTYSTKIVCSLNFGLCCS